MNGVIGKEERVYEGKQYHFSFRPYHEALLSLLPSKTRSKVLECGVGDGFLLQELAGRGFACTGLELIPKNLALAKGKGLHVIKQDLNEPFKLPSNAFDIVIALEVLEHLWDYGQALREMHRVLRKDGLAFVSVPNCTYWRYQCHLLFQQEMPNEYSGIEGHVNHYSLNQWKRKLESHFTVHVHATERLVKAFPFLPANLFNRYAFFECRKK